MVDCVICETPYAEMNQATNGWYGTCLRCGQFGITFEALSALMDVTDRYRVSGWLYDQQRLGVEQPDIDLDRLKHIRSLPPIPLSERPRRLLRELLSSISTTNEYLQLDDRRLAAAIHANHHMEVNQVFDYLVEDGYLVRPTLKACQFTMRGLIRAEEMLAQATAARQGFVAMWFDKSLQSVYENGIEPAIRDAGFDPFRIDRLEHVNRIDDEIIAQIRQSRFLVADFTGHRGGVYFEAGYAMGRDLPVIWTCRDDDLKELHFDTRQYNFIAWKKPEELYTRLKHRIGAILG